MNLLYSDTQYCPVCKIEVEDHLSNWSTDDDYSECNNCGESYIARPQYTFEGWEIKKICKVCNEECEEDEICCEGEDE